MENYSITTNLDNLIWIINCIIYHFYINLPAFTNIEISFSFFCVCTSRCEIFLNPIKNNKNEVRGQRDAKTIANYNIG